MKKCVSVLLVVVFLWSAFLCVETKPSYAADFSVEMGTFAGITVVSVVLGIADIAEAANRIGKSDDSSKRIRTAAEVGAYIGAASGVIIAAWIPGVPKAAGALAGGIGGAVVGGVYAWW